MHINEHEVPTACLESCFYKANLNCIQFEKEETRVRGGQLLYDLMLLSDRNLRSL